MAIDPIKLEERLDKVAIGATEISMGFGGVKFQTMIELLEFSKLMALSGAAVPPHLRNNPGACLAVCTRALRFNFDPFTLAEHSYLVTNKGVETIAFDSFVLAAIIEAHAPLTGRLRITYAGEGDERRCTVRGFPRGEKEPLEHTSPTLGELKAARGRNDYGKIKGSPLWESPKSDQQLAYDTRRDFCRKFFPEVILGWYDKDEFDESVRAERATDVTPKLSERLKGNKGKRGFQADNVQALEHKPGETIPESTTQSQSEPVPVSVSHEPVKAEAEE